MKKITIAAILGAVALSASGKTIVTPHPDAATDTISRMIYGQFAEHLGSCIYGGIWVGLDSDIPNTDGYRNDALEALRNLEVPVLRWPGGCFADDYHWRDGIGPADQRPTLINNNWGGTKEDNSFGTHEFLNLCELLGIEPYVSGNVGSGTVGEMAQWVEYMTAPAGPMADERAANGRREPWKVRFFGIGNESWGCGGNMRPEYYSDVYRRYATYLRDQPGNRLFKIASGASDYDYRWTETLMDRIGAHRMDGLSVHYYTVDNWDHKGSATDFDTDVYYTTIGKACQMDSVIRRHSQIMDQYDPKGRTAMLVDEWGTWFDVEPGTNPGHLFQQNTMRDAIVAGLTLNIFHRHADRVKMANIAQIANVLQAMWLTEGDKLILTPTYHTFRLYAPHKDAVAIPVDVDAAMERDVKGREFPTLSVTASRASDSSVTFTFVNPMLTASDEIEIDLSGLPDHIKSVQILAADDVHARNTFDAPETVAPAQFQDAKVRKGKLLLQMPAASIVSITLN